MFTLLRRCTGRDLVFIQAPSFLLALVIAELLYKFHSFLLETGAFLLTWLVLDVVLSLATGALRKSHGRASG